MKRSISDLRQRQLLPLESKICMSQRRILEWVKEFGENNVYISFSGGKDSTVLLHLVRQIFPDILAVYVDTGLEYPEIRNFVKQHDNVKIIRPKMSFKDVISTFGYPVISKAVSNCIYAVRFGHSISRRIRLFGEYTKIDGSKSQFNCSKYLPLLSTDFIVSDRCCGCMKKSPIHIFERQNDMKSFTAQMACESLQRQSVWLKNGCNAFDSKHQISNPLSFWTEQDIFQYIKKFHLEICSVYGDIIPEDGQMVFDGMPCKYCTTGCNRTGCIFCGFGAHLEKGETRFQRLKKTHPKQYDFCIGGGAYDVDNGYWKPDKNGLGMGHVFDTLNSLYGENFINYK